MSDRTGTQAHEGAGSDDQRIGGGSEVPGQEAGSNAAPGVSGAAGPYVQGRLKGPVGRVLSRIGLARKTQNQSNGFSKGLNLFDHAMKWGFWLLILTVSVEVGNRIWMQSDPLNTSTLWLMTGNFIGVGQGLLKDMAPSALEKNEGR